MPSFLHLPTQRVVETDNHSQLLRYRRSSRFTELPDPPESHESHEDAPDNPSDPSGTPDTTDISKYTVAQVLAWVDNDPDRARQALQAEQASKQRVTLLAALRRIT